MAVVTISRQIGSFGYAIGQLAADRLGYKIAWRELINQAALRAGAPAVALAMIDELRLLGLCPTKDECLAYIKAVTQVVNELAEEGNMIIVGRAGQVILAKHPDTIHLRVIAPTETRAQRLVERHNVPIQAAREQVAASDRYRQNYLRRFHQVPWAEPTLYDLILNTGRLDNDTAVEIICKLVRLHQNRKVYDPSQHSGDQL